MGVVRSAGWRIDKDTDKERFIVVMLIRLPPNWSLNND